MSLYTLNKGKMTAICDFLYEIKRENDCSKYYGKEIDKIKIGRNTFSTDKYIPRGGCGGDTHLNLKINNEFIDKDIEKSGALKQWYIKEINNKVYLSQVFLKGKEKIFPRPSIKNDEVFLFDNGKLVKVCSDEKKITKFYKKR